MIQSYIPIMVQKTKKRNKEETMSKIIDTSRSLIAEKGYKQVSTNLIAEKLDISVGTLYHHFPRGKIQIITHIFNNDLSLIFSEEVLIKLYDFPFEQSVNLLIDHIYDHYLSDIRMFRGFTTAYLINPELFHEYNKTYFLSHL